MPGRNDDCAEKDLLDAKIDQPVYFGFIFFSQSLFPNDCDSRCRIYGKWNIIGASVYFFFFLLCFRRTSARDWTQKNQIDIWWKSRPKTVLLAINGNRNSIIIRYIKILLRTLATHARTHRWTYMNIIMWCSNNISRVCTVGLYNHYNIKIKFRFFFSPSACKQNESVCA